MEKKDYLPFYIGCEGIAETIIKFKTSLVAYNGTGDLRKGIGLNEAEQYRFKPLLRPLDTITEEEADAWYRGKLPHPLHAWLNYGPHRKELYTPTQFMWLLSKRFDLFNLIPEGLALDATKEVNHG